MKGVLFVCQGNMVRSQIAEVLYKKYKGPDVFSAGIYPIIEEHDGEKLKNLSLQILIEVMKNKEGIDVSNNICKEVTKEMVQKADKIIVMANKEILPDFLKNAKNMTFWEVSDQISDYKRCEEIIEIIKEKILSLFLK